MMELKVRSTSNKEGFPAVRKLEIRHKLVVI